MTASAPQTARARARAELTGEITTIARRQLANSGPGELSLRAVAREMGMASSALYRYFPSRDALLTQLIIESYDELGDACDKAVSAVAEDDLLGRFRAIAHSIRRWARANPQEYALIYGSPVVGYAAPMDTVDPASRIIRHLIGLTIAIDQSDDTMPLPQVEIPSTLADQITSLLNDDGIAIDRQRFLAASSVWAQLFGMVSFEVFGRYNGMFDNADALFAHQVDRAAIFLGLKL